MNSNAAIETISHLQKVDVPTWEVEILSAASTKSIDFVSFDESSTAYGVGFSEVMRFSKERKWEKVADTAPFGIWSLRFRGDGLGIAAGYDKRQGPGRVGVLLVSTDGGHEWKNMHTAPSVIFEGAVPGNGESFWAFGRFKTDAMSPEARYYLAASKDNGRSWVDLSTSLNSIVLKEQTYVGDYITDAIVSSDRISILTILGRVFESNDDGATWTIATHFEERRPTCVCQLGRSPSGKLWVAGGTASEHGIWGIVALQADRAWATHRTNGVRFNDVVLLSDNEVLAVGDEYKDGSLSRNGRGIVLYSSNGGVSWEVVHRSLSSKEYSSIRMKDQTTILVGGQGGELISLQRK